MKYTKKDLTDYFCNHVIVTITNQSGKYPANCKFKTLEGCLIYKDFRVKHGTLRITKDDLRDIYRIIKAYFIEHHIRGA